LAGPNVFSSPFMPCTFFASFTVSLKGITQTQAARHSRIAHDHPRSRAEPSGPQCLYGDCTVRLPGTIRNTAKSLLQKVKISKACCYLAIPPRFGHRGRGYEEPHRVLSVSQDAIARDKPHDPSSDKAPGAESSTSEPKGQELVYAARISLDRTQMQVEENLVNLSPGMAVTVEVKTGSRTVLTYLLSPLLRYKQQSLRER
jgi:hypothetical protein